jgi:acetyl-CoA C-acetyltransferase
MESMSNVPHLTMARGGMRYGNLMMVDGIQKDGLIDAYGAGAMGFCGEKTAKEFEITREIQDEYALSSYERYA